MSSKRRRGGQRESELGELPAKRPGPSQAREFSAGGVVVRDGSEVVVIVPTRRGADGQRVLALPKGHVDPGESAVQAAQREVREETGSARRATGIAAGDAPSPRPSRSSCSTPSRAISPTTTTRSRRFAG
jgi:8-oxo-dGTP pyrophosphatase MutT (NUDIX family)